jgi:hypothetical protein
VTRDKASKQKNRIPAVRAWCNQLLFKLITIFNICIIVKSYKMDIMTIAERARAVDILVSGFSLRQHFLSVSISSSKFHDFLGILQHG